MTSPTESENTPVAPEAIAPEAEDAAASENDAETVTENNNEAEVFPAKVVKKLRKENAQYRKHAKDRDEIAARLHVELVKATGKLADPSDLAFNEAHLSDPQALDAAIAELLNTKPHLGSRKPFGDIGQGAQSQNTHFSLGQALRQRA